MIRIGLFVGLLSTCYGHELDTIFTTNLPIAIAAHNHLEDYIDYNDKNYVFRADYVYNIQTERWMKFHVIPSTWKEARLRCYAEGAVLASPLTETLKRELISFVQWKKHNIPTTIFTGIHATFSKGDYTSVEGVPLSSIPITWSAGEPDNFENQESCLAMVTDSKGSMSDVKCTEVLPYVCYKKLERFTKTNCGTVDQEYKLDSRTGSCYKFHRKPRTWSQAFMTCIAEGGHLVILNSETEAILIKELADRNPSNPPKYTGALAVGFHDWGDHYTFMTIHGETLDKAGFDRWSENQPDNSTKPQTGDLGEYCGGIFRANHLLNDLWCNMPVPFVCEMKPDSLI